MAGRLKTVLPVLAVGLLPGCAGEAPTPSPTGVAALVSTPSSAPNSADATGAIRDNAGDAIAGPTVRLQGT